MRVAVLDLGTNTFNLVIAEKSNDEIKILVSKKYPVKLGEGGINQGRISPEAFQRGIEAVESHFQTIQHHQVDMIKAFGTSALRTAANGKEFTTLIKHKTNIDIEVISGDKEAELIYYGIRQTHPMQEGKYLLLDIGGGSNEFIIADQKRIYWKKSYQLGIARLLELFNPSDPITAGEIVKVEDYISSQIEDLREQVKKHEVSSLIGASGSFETFTAMISRQEKITEAALEAIALPIAMDDFDTLYSKLIESTLAVRKVMKGLELMRVEMIVLAVVFVKFIIENLGIRTLYQSNFSLKEGVVYELLNQ